jgi:hypothetical protein
MDGVIDALKDSGCFKDLQDLIVNLSDPETAPIGRKPIAWSALSIGSNRTSLGLIVFRQITL